MNMDWEMKNHLLFKHRIGGYLLLGTSLTVSTNQSNKDLFLVSADNRGKKLWEKKSSGQGRTTGNLLMLDAERISIIAGSYREYELEKKVR